HIASLADDRLLGRKPCTEGCQMAVDYVVKEFKAMGNPPAGDPGQFTQKLILRSSKVVYKSSKAYLFDSNGNVDSLAFRHDFLPYAHPLMANAAGHGKLDFVNYGVDAPGIYSEYFGVDVKGKVVVFLAGVQDVLPASTLVSHFGSAGNKLNTAAEKGSKGAILIYPMQSFRD
ncbi:MAG: peptidase M28, partial [Algoriphagus sp.]